MPKELPHSEDYYLDIFDLDKYTPEQLLWLEVIRVAMCDYARIRKGIFKFTMGTSIYFSLDKRKIEQFFFPDKEGDYCGLECILEAIEPQSVERCLNLIRTVITKAPPDKILETYLTNNYKYAREY